jgi:hypothetical protein
VYTSGDQADLRDARRSMKSTDRALTSGCPIYRNNVRHSRWKAVFHGKKIVAMGYTRGALTVLARNAGSFRIERNWAVRGISAHSNQPVIAPLRYLSSSQFGMQTVFFAEPDVTERSVDAAAAATPSIKNQACNVAQSLAKIGRSASASGLLTTRHVSRLNADQIRKPCDNASDNKLIMTLDCSH